jgi:hypothetical protein
MPDHLYAARFEIEHVIARQHLGTDAPSNLAYSCLRCNSFKGPNLSSIDYQTSRTRLVRLFHPRRHAWPFHFRRDGPLIFGKTRIGRVTVRLLKMNEIPRVALRTALIREGLVPADW